MDFFSCDAKCFCHVGLDGCAAVFLFFFDFEFAGGILVEKKRIRDFRGLSHLTRVRSLWTYVQTLTLLRDFCCFMFTVEKIGKPRGYWARVFYLCVD